MIQKGILVVFFSLGEEIMKIDPIVYEKARIAATALKAEIEQMILGQKRPAYSCCCGAISNGVSTATEVQPAGSDPKYQDQIGLWYMWTVKMREDDNTKLAPGNYSYSLGISNFVEISLLKDMFKRYFVGIGVEVSN